MERQTERERELVWEEGEKNTEEDRDGETCAKQHLRRRERWLRMCAGGKFPNNICTEINICNEREGREVRRAEEDLKARSAPRR